MKRASWAEYQKDIADDHYYYARSCIRQNFFPGSEKLFLEMLRSDLGRDVLDDPLHSSCTGIGYHSDIVPLDTIMAVVARTGLRQAPSGFMEPRDRFLGSAGSGVEGIFYAGAVTAPKNLGESLCDGAAAALAVRDYLNPCER